MSLKGAKLFGDLLALGAKVCSTEVYNAIKQGERTTRGDQRTAQQSQVNV